MTACVSLGVSGVAAGRADAYLHVDSAFNTCYNAEYPSAAANLAPYGFTGYATNGYTRHSDTDVTMDMIWDSNTVQTYQQGGATYYAYMSDRFICRVQGDDPGTIVSLADWGLAYR